MSVGESEKIDSNEILQSLAKELLQSRQVSSGLQLPLIDNSLINERAQKFLEFAEKLKDAESDMRDSGPKLSENPTVGEMDNYLQWMVKNTVEPELGR